jgi:hypothetical protein
LASDLGKVDASKGSKESWQTHTGSYHCGKRPRTRRSQGSRQGQGGPQQARRVVHELPQGTPRWRPRAGRVTILTEGAGRHMGFVACARVHLRLQTAKRPIGIHQTSGRVYPSRDKPAARRVSFFPNLSHQAILNKISYKHLTIDVHLVRIPPTCKRCDFHI